MHIPLITGFYAGLLGIVVFLLTWRVGRIRSRTNIALMDGGNRELIVAIRGQGNFIELVPLCLILLAVAEMASTSIYVIHILGVILLVSRLIHPFGLSPDRMNTWQRMIGAGGTMIVLLILSVWAIYLYLIRVALISV
jgi:uncharacterized membrane protein YecN with MAPEG domain